MLHYPQKLIKIRARAQEQFASLGSRSRPCAGQPLFARDSQQQLRAAEMVLVMHWRREHSAALHGTAKATAVENHGELEGPGYVCITRLRTHPGIALLPSDWCTRYNWSVAHAIPAKWRPYADFDPVERSSAEGVQALCLIQRLCCTIYMATLRFLHTRLLRYLPLIKSTNDLDSLGCGTQFQPCRQSRACFARGGLVFLAYAGVLFQPPLCLGPFPLQLTVS